VLQRTSRWSKPPLELCKVFSDSARAFSRASESTCSDGGAFRMLRNLNIRIVIFWSSCAGPWLASRAAKTSVQDLQETWCRILTPVVLTVPYPQGISSIILVCYSHKIRYIILWHVLSKSLYIYTYGDTVIMEMDSATGSIYLESPRVDRHHLNIRNTHSIFPSAWSHAL